MASISDKTKNWMRAQVRRIVRWSVVESAGDDRGGFPVQQISYLNRAGLSAAWYPFGYHAIAEEDSQALLFTISGQSDARVHFPGSPKDRPEVKPGEVVLYHPKSQSKIYLKNDGDIEIIAKDQAKITAPNGLTINANTQINGTLTVSDTTKLDGTVDINNTVDVSHQTHFHNAVLVDNTTDNTGTYDLREHVHRRGSSNTTPPFDAGDYP